MSEGDVLEGPRLIFGMFLEAWWVPRLATRAENCGQTFLPSFLLSGFPHVAKQVDNCGTELWPWVPPLVAFALPLNYSLRPF